MQSTKNTDERRLTPKQLKILTYIAQHLSRAGRPPTIREIASGCGKLAVGTVQDHLRALIAKGFLEKTESVSCGLRLSHHSPSADIPILGSVPAGNPLEAISSAAGSLSVTLRGASECYALKVKGESMVDAGILDGDFVIVRRQPDADNGDIVVALIDGEATVKFLEKRRGLIRLMPANPRFKPIELEPGRENLIQGKVVALQRFF